MAQSKQKQQSAPPGPALNKRRPPEYVCRCRKNPSDRYSKFYMHIGVAWAIQITDQETGEVTGGYAVKLEAMPPNFDGSFVIMLKKDKPQQAEVALEESH